DGRRTPRPAQARDDDQEGGRVHLVLLLARRDRWRCRALVQDRRTKLAAWWPALLVARGTVHLQRLFELVHEVARGVVPGLAQELVASGNLDDGAHIAARAHGQRDLAHGHAEDLARLLLEPQPI